MWWIVALILIANGLILALKSRAEEGEQESGRSQSLQQKSSFSDNGSIKCLDKLRKWKKKWFFIKHDVL